AATGWVRDDGSVDLAAFLPNTADVDGLSLSRAGTAAEVGATGKKGKKFYAVRLSVAALRAKGLKVSADSADHAIIEGWTKDARHNPDVRSLAAWMTTICAKPEGPFDGETEPA